MDDLELIKKNAQLVIDQLGAMSEINFGLNRDSVDWVEGYIERQRVRPDISPETIHKLVSVLGSFLGECIIASAGGSWQWSDEDGWGVVFPNNCRANPLSKVRKLFDNGLEGGDSIVSFYDVAVEYVSQGKLNSGPGQPQP